MITYRWDRASQTDGVRVDMMIDRPLGHESNEE